MICPDGCTIAEVAREDGKVAPAIFASEKGNVEVLTAPLAFAFAQVDRQRPYQRVRHLISSIAQFLTYYIDSGLPELDPRGLRKLVEEYLLQRANGVSELGWPPLSRSALEAEARNIAESSDFSEREFGHLPLVGRCCVPLPVSVQNRSSFWRLMALNERDLFSHLAIRRDPKQERIKIPKRANRRGGTDSFVGMTEEFAWTLIGAERNPTYKALWILSFFGGPRLSEMLNLWVCDVLPGTWREYWFKGDVFVDLPLVVIADPWQSRWCGKLGDERITREEYLLRKFGLPPRPTMAETDCGSNRGRVAGFKGSNPTNRSGAMRQIFWAREEAARTFEVTVVEVMRTRNLMPRSKLHPFLFVNTDPRKPNLQGDMLSASNARKAFERAVRRIGGIPYRSRNRPHGMRHLYKDLIKELVNGDAGAIQICMGHRSRQSQDDYGSLDMRALRHAMAAAGRSGQ